MGLGIDEFILRHHRGSRYIYSQLRRVSAPAPSEAATDLTAFEFEASFAHSRSLNSGLNRDADTLSPPISRGPMSEKLRGSPLFQDPVRSTTGAEAALFFTDARFSRASSLPL